MKGFVSVAVAANSSLEQCEENQQETLPAYTDCRVLFRFNTPLPEYSACETFFIWMYLYNSGSRKLCKGWSNYAAVETLDLHERPQNSLHFHKSKVGLINFLEYLGQVPIKQLYILYKNAQFLYKLLLHLQCYIRQTVAQGAFPSKS